MKLQMTDLHLHFSCIEACIRHHLDLKPENKTKTQLFAKRTTILISMAFSLSLVQTHIFSGATETCFHFSEVTVKFNQTKV